MKRVYRTWGVLAGAYALGRFSTEFLLSHTVTLQGEAIAQLILLPVIQTLLLQTLAGVRARMPLLRQQPGSLATTAEPGVGRPAEIPPWAPVSTALLLFLSHAFLAHLIGFLGFGLLDFRRALWVQYFVTPLLQLSSIWWIQTKPDAIAYSQRFFSVLRQSFVLSQFLFVDLLVLAFCWSLPGVSWVSISQHGSFAWYYTGFRGLLAAGILLVLAARNTNFRYLYCAISAGLFGYSVDFFLPWLAQIPEELFPDLGMLASGALVFVPMFLVAVWVFVVVTGWLRRTGARAEVFAIWAAPLSLASASIYVAALYDSPVLSDLQYGIVRTFGFLMVTAILLAAVCQLTEVQIQKLEVERKV